MITFVQGNIFESSAQVITNTVNCAGVMGAGLALQFKNKFPSMYSDYKSRCDKNTVIAGIPYLWEDDQTQILNFPTKRHWKDDSLLTDIDAGLKYLANNYQTMGIQSLAIPPLGCGLGGLNWNEVKPLIEKYFASVSDLEVYVYETTASIHNSNNFDQKNSQIPFNNKDDAAASSL